HCRSLNDVSRLLLFSSVGQLTIPTSATILVSSVLLRMHLDGRSSSGTRRKSKSHRQSIDDHIERASQVIERTDGTGVLLNVARALLARAIFIVHSIATIWQTVKIEGKNSVWGFALISIIILFEGGHTIILRAGDERKWFCPSVLLYIIATAPPIWLLETKMCEWKLTQDSAVVSDEKQVRLQMLEQLMLVVVIIGRWLLPKGDISREQLSQILLAYLAIASDIVEFFDVFKEEIVWRDPTVQNIILATWTLSLLQFPFVLTVSRARKMRVAIIKTYDGMVVEHRHRRPANVIYDVDLWAIILANALQDIPFISVRLFLMFNRGLVTYTMIFFTCKNALIIALQTYRAFVLYHDRYLYPQELPEEIYKRRHSHGGRKKTKLNREDERQQTYTTKHPTIISRKCITEE
ncbi:hypothetical protein AB6A40_005500, partial [Gnathostoma spinigerum]